MAPEPPYYAVIFTSRRRGDDAAYHATAERMLQLAAQQPGFIGVESARDSEGMGITVSYWHSAEAIAAWKMELEHVQAQQQGRACWYEHYQVRVARVERHYAFERPAQPD